MSATYTKTVTFTIVHARHLASKVAADMNLCSRYYGEPPEHQIRAFAEELAQYLNENYIDEYEFGFKKDEKRIVSWRYKADSNGILTTDDNSGKVVPHVDISGAIFFNFLTQNSRFFGLSTEDQARFKAQLPVQRTGGVPPSDGPGYWVSDRNYFSGGCAMSRRTFQSLS